MTRFQQGHGARSAKILERTHVRAGRASRASQLGGCGVRGAGTSVFDYLGALPRNVCGLAEQPAQ